MKATAIRWTLGMAALEFGIDRRTVATRAKGAGLVPGEDGKFSTAQVTRALHGDLAGERLRKLRAEADLAEIEAQDARKERIPIDVITFLTEQTFRAIATIIKCSRLPAAEKQEIFTELRTLPLAYAQKGFPLPPEDAESIREAAPLDDEAVLRPKGETATGWRTPPPES